MGELRFGPQGVLFGDLGALLRATAREAFVAANPSPFLLKLPGSQLERDEALAPALPRGDATKRLAPAPDLLEPAPTVNLSVPDLLSLGARRGAAARRVHQLQLPAGKDTLVVGRADDSDLFLDDTTVSKRHALLRSVAGAWRVIDLGSSNGTFVDGVRLAANVPTPIAERQNLWFSSYRALLIGAGPLYDLATRQR